MKKHIQVLKGFRDLYPNDMAWLNWLFSKMRKVSQLYGYQEYEGPALENLSLYQTKSGDELVKEQTFILKDRSGRNLALRPEMTPTLARMVVQKSGQLNFPLRWFSIGRRWRYEKPQKGRFREFWQWDVDLIGNDTPEADAEIIAIACRFFQKIGLSSKEVTILVNNRRLMEQKLDLIGISEKQKSLVFRAIDKKDKSAEEEWINLLEKAGLNKLQIKDLKGILEDKDFGGESDELTLTFSTLQDLGFSDYVEFDPCIVRGLDYYTGTVFEARDKKGKFRAILGGGRYDDLLGLVGGPKLSGVGFATGDAVLRAVMEEYDKLPNLATSSTQALITTFDESSYRESLKTAKILRNKGISTEIYLKLEKLDKQLKYADKKGIAYVLIIGEEEVKQNKVTLKDMKTGNQQTTSLKQSIKLINSKT